MSALRRPTIRQCLLLALIGHGCAAWFLSRYVVLNAIDALPVQPAPALAVPTAMKLELVYDESALSSSPHRVNPSAGGKRISAGKNVTHSHSMLPRGGSSLRAEGEGPSDDFTESQATVEHSPPTVSPAPGQTTEPPENSPQRPRLSLRDMAIGGGNAFVLAHELRQPSERQQIEDKLNDSFARGVLESDSVRTSSTGFAIRNVIEEAARMALTRPTRGFLKIWLTPDGEVADVKVLEGASEDAAWRELAARLKGRRIHQSSVRRPLVLTYDIQQGPRLSSGRSPGTRLSIGGISTGKSDAASDSMHVQLIPPRLRLKKPLVLDPSGSGGTTTQSDLPVYVEQTLLDVDLDPADVSGGEQNSLTVRLVRREVL